MASFSQNVMAFDPPGSDDDFASDNFEDSRVELKAIGHNLVSCGYIQLILQRQDVLSVSQLSLESFLHVYYEF